MNKNKLALEIVKDLRNLANNIEIFLKAMAEEKSVTLPVISNKAASRESESITLEKVRGVLASKAQSGKQQEVKELITKHGGQKLTDLNPCCYEELLKEAEGL